jgi:cytochrome c oxidase subunit 2
VRGTPAAGVLGPDLTHVGSRRKIASGIMDNTPENMARWIENPPAVKPGALMPQLSLDQATIDALVFYLQNLD